MEFNVSFAKYMKYIYDKKVNQWILKAICTDRSILDYYAICFYSFVDEFITSLMLMYHFR